LKRATFWITIPNIKKGRRVVPGSAGALTDTVHRDPHFDHAARTSHQGAARNLVSVNERHQLGEGT
jgi:hypothetical protein